MMRDQLDGVRFRKTTRTDAPFINALMESYRDIFCEMQTTEVLGEGRTDSLLASRGKQSLIILRGDTGSPIGWTMFEIMQGDICKLHAMTLKPDPISQSLARNALMQLMSELRQQAKRVMVDVQRGNVRAVRFYQQNGFRIVAEKMEQTGDGVKPYYVMRHELL